MKGYVLGVLASSGLLYLAVGFNVSILRPCISIIYLVFVPGFVVLKALKVDHEKTSFVLYSVGLSTAIVMFLGLAVNQFGFLFPAFKPLTILPLTVAVSGFTLVVLFIACKDDFVSSDRSEPHSDTVKKSTFLRGLLLVTIPLLSVAGALSNNSLLLAGIIIAIAVLIGLCISSRIIPSQIFVVLIFSVSIALLLQTSLISRYLMGWDIHLEDYVFKTVMANGLWSPLRLGIDSDVARFESVLSITILPTIYSLFSGLSQEVLFKIVYPLIFSLIPLVLFQTYKAQMDKKLAVLSVFFFMSQPFGFFGAEPLSLARQIIAELFLVLSVYLLVDKRIQTTKKWLLFLIFGGALIMSHYALSYFYVFFLALALIVLRRWKSRELLNLTTFLIIFVMTFAWYTYVSDAPFLKVENDVRRIYNNFGADLLNPQARSSAVSTLAAAPPSIVSVIHRVLFYIENVLMFIGVALLVLKKKTKFDPVYAMMAVASMLMLIMTVAIPGFAGAFQLTRFYAITIIFLAPFFATGGQATFQWLSDKSTAVLRKTSSRVGWTSSKNIAILLVAILLMASFLFDTGLVDHMTNGYPDSLSLDNNRRRISPDPSIRINYFSIFIPSQDVYSTIWLGDHRDKKSSIYADGDAKAYVLRSYSLIPHDQIYPILMYSATSPQSLVYLRYVNVVQNTLVSLGFFNTSELSNDVNSINKIYSNGGSDIYAGSG